MIASEILAKPTTRTRSAQAFESAQAVLPGGVNSPVRAFKSVGGSPIFMAKAQGAHIWDVDGNRYIDCVGSFGPAILGHAHPQVVTAVQSAAQNGFCFGAPTELETTLAQEIIAAVPSIEMVRLVNSGTEAALSAARLARAVTGRQYLIKFAGCYHGHADAFLVKAGSGATTLGQPDSSGVPASVANYTLTATFNNADSVAALLSQYPEQVAAILVEPVVGNMGCVPPAEGFLQELRDLADASGALLVFDEVMTGFRVAYGGAQSLYGVTPDITCLGKIIGGGLPVGAYGASKKIMQHVAPAGPMYQAGTLSGNPMAVTAGLETLRLLQQPNTYQTLETNGEYLAQGLQKACDDANIPAQVQRVGSMITIFFTENPVVDYETALASDRERFNKVFWGLLNRGVSIPPSPFEAWFTSLAHTPEVMDTIIAAFTEALKDTLL
ncbi:MAG: glutamate-1-semialdehyde 2,1-aminomutase [Vampirovibrionales bacterium]